MSFFLCVCFSEKISLGILWELSAKKMTHMKCQALFAQKNTEKNPSVVCYSCD